MAGHRNCGNTFCELSYEFVSTCTLYVPKDESLVCDYPCSEKNCVTETSFFVTCPVWQCSPFTTLSPLDPTIGPLDPTVTPFPVHPDCSSALCIGSVTLSGLLLSIVLAILAVAIFLKRTNRLHVGHQVEYNPNRGHVELSDLLEREAERQQQREREPLLGGQEVGAQEGQQTNPSAVASPAGFENVLIV